MDEGLTDFLIALTWGAPTYLTLFAGIVFVLARWERHPAASLLAAAGFGWMILVSVGETAFRNLVAPDLFANRPPLDVEETLCYLTFSALEALGLVGVILAVVVGRRPPPSPFMHDPPGDFDRHGPT